MLLTALSCTSEDLQSQVVEVAKLSAGQFEPVNTVRSSIDIFLAARRSRVRPSLLRQLWILAKTAVSKNPKFAVSKTKKHLFFICFAFCCFVSVSLRKCAKNKH